MARDLVVGCIGTSLSAGIGQSRTWQDALRRALLPGMSRDARVLNFGVPGGTSTGAVDSAYLDPICRYRMDAAIIELCMNDASTANSISTTTSGTNLQTVISALRSAYSDILVFPFITNNCVSGETAALARPNLANYYTKYRDIVTADNTLHLIDPSWGTANLTNIPDGLHPSAAHWDAVAIPAIVTVIKPYLVALP